MLQAELRKALHSERSVGSKPDSNGQIQSVQHLIYFRRHPRCPSSLKLNHQWWDIPCISIHTFCRQLAFLFQCQMEQTPRRGAEPSFSSIPPFFKGNLLFTSEELGCPSIKWGITKAFCNPCISVFKFQYLRAFSPTSRSHQERVFQNSP